MLPRRLWTGRTFPRDSSSYTTLADVLSRLSLTGGVDDAKKWGRVRLDDAVVGAAGGGVDGSGVGALLIAAAPLSTPEGL